MTTEQIVYRIFTRINLTGIEPATFTLPDGRVIPWNPYLAHNFAAKNRITEEEFIEMSMNQ